MAHFSRRRFVGGSVALLGAAGLRLPLRVLALESPNVSPAQFLRGVDYYPDQTPESLWEEDARMMAETGITNVRIAEFAWALMEPAEGKYDFAWLHRADYARGGQRMLTVVDPTGLRAAGQAVVAALALILVRLVLALAPALS